MTWEHNFAKSSTSEIGPKSSNASDEMIQDTRLDQPPGQTPEDARMHAPQREGSASSDDGDEDEESSVENLLAGGAGTQLVRLLGQLSNHLGGGSRFSNIARVLQHDLIEHREVVQRDPPVSSDLIRLHPEDSHASPPRLDPREGSALAAPGVMDSMSSMLRVLDGTFTANRSTPQWVVQQVTPHLIPSHPLSHPTWSHFVPSRPTTRHASPSHRIIFWQSSPQPAPSTPGEPLRPHCDAAASIARSAQPALASQMA